MINKNAKRTILIFLGIALSIGLIAFGISISENKTVLTKATKICTECIGIG